jgi:hypothetical protein
MSEWSLRGSVCVFYSRKYSWAGSLWLQAIWEELQDAVHAVDAMVTRTPGEAGM